MRRGAQVAYKRKKKEMKWLQALHSPILKFILEILLLKLIPMNSSGPPPHPFTDTLCGPWFKHHPKKT